MAKGKVEQVEADDIADDNGSDVKVKRLRIEDILVACKILGIEVDESVLPEQREYKGKRVYPKLTITDTGMETKEGHWYVVKLGKSSKMITI